MNKHTSLMIGFAGLAISICALLYLFAPSIRSNDVLMKSLNNLPTLPVLEAQDAPTFTQDPAPFNLQEPSLIGTIVAINGTLVDLDVVEQPKELSGLLVNRRRVRVSASTASTLEIGKQVQVFTRTAADLQMAEIPAIRVESMERE